MAGKFVSIQVPVADWASFGTTIAQESEELVKFGTPKNLNRSSVVSSLLNGFLAGNYDVAVENIKTDKAMKGVVIEKDTWKRARTYVIDKEVKGGLSALVATLVRAYNKDELKAIE